MCGSGRRRQYVSMLLTVELVLVVTVVVVLAAVVVGAMFCFHFCIYLYAHCVFMTDIAVFKTSAIRKLLTETI